MASAFYLPFSTIRRSKIVLNDMIECQIGDFESNVIKESAVNPVIVDFYAEV